MKIVIIGAAGHVGRTAVKALEDRHEIVALSRSSTPPIDLEDPESVTTALSEVGPVDAVVVAAGSVPFKPLLDLSREDYTAAFTSKVLGQITIAQAAVDHLADGGSITVTTGVLSRAPIATGAAAAMANGAVESWVMAAATELPRSIRVNAVSPDVLENSPHYHEFFPGFVPVSDESVGHAFVRSVEGVETGKVFAV